MEHKQELKAVRRVIAISITVARILDVVRKTIGAREGRRIRSSMAGSSKLCTGLILMYSSLLESPRLSKQTQR